MDSTGAVLVPMDSGSPLIEYGIAFQKRPKLLMAGSGVFEGSSSVSDTYAGVPAKLEGEIRWGPHVDEADRVDYIVAVSSGVLAGLIDAFYVGEFSLDRAGEWGEGAIEKLVMKAARMEGYTGDNAKEAIRTLERSHPFAADGNTSDFGGGLQHHLRDFSHHFSISGLFFSILTQLTGLVVGADTAGNLLVVPVPESHKAYIGKSFQEKMVFGVIGWFFHMVSDMAGSSGSAMGGTGIPGPLVSFMKELSALPFFTDSDDGDMGFRLWVTKLFNGTLLADHDDNGRIIRDSVRKFDLRTEIGILGELSRQTVPVLVNQCLVRGFYFCRRLAREIQDRGIGSIGDLERIAPEDVLPWGTPAMRRMITVSSGIFTGVDIADAAVRAIMSKNPVAFLLRVNYVGVASLVIACVVEGRAALEDAALKEGEEPEKAYERGLSSALSRLTLDFMQTRILHSIERAIITHDIEAETRPERAEKKRTWLKEWSENLLAAVDLLWAADAGYFLEDEAIYSSISTLLGRGANDSSLWLIAMEAKRFTPYAPLHGHNDTLYKGLKAGNDYLGEVFCKRQDIVDAKGLTKLDKAMNSTRGKLDGATTKRVAGTAGTVVAVAATGGIAFSFAPLIAPALAGALGFEAAALSGAALTSASLAFLGGGALAAGGAGMAGGAMFIAGGGALLGAVGGSGLSAAMSMTLATNGSFVLEECAKLVVFCKEVLVGRYDDLASVAEIHAALNREIIDFDAKIERIKRRTPSDDEDTADEKDKPSAKKMIKILNRSRTFMERSRKELAKMLKGRDLSEGGSE